MKIFSTYSVKIKHYNHIFKDTVSIYRHAVDFLINVCLNEWNDISDIQNNLLKQKYIESLYFMVEISMTSYYYKRRLKEGMERNHV